jgi:hypothetical protein
MIWIPICGTLLKQEAGTNKRVLYNNWAKYWILGSVLMNAITPEDGANKVQRLVTTVYNNNNSGYYQVSCLLFKT